MSTTNELTTTQVSQSMCPTVEQCVPETSVNQVTVMETIIGDIVTETTRTVSTIGQPIIYGPAPTGPFTVTLTVPGMADQYTTTETTTEVSLVEGNSATIPRMETVTLQITNQETVTEPTSEETEEAVSEESDQESKVPEPEEDTGGLPLGAIIALVIICALILATIISWLLWRRRQKRREELEQRVQPQAYYPPTFEPPLSYLDTSYHDDHNAGKH
ncbi:hypothetical protein GGF46_004476 [Coemansia sp. RSA 552]|nr:hypothetical protein GGF46_004476 [Coemansia sp. RSA 552]